jgi:hypothetical protein
MYTPTGSIHRFSGLEYIAGVNLIEQVLKLGLAIFNIAHESSTITTRKYRV